MNKRIHELAEQANEHDTEYEVSYSTPLVCIAAILALTFMMVISK